MGMMGTLAKVALGYAAARGVDRMSGGQGLGSLLGGGAQVKAKTPAAQAQGQLGQAASGKMPGEGNPMSGMMAQLQNGPFGSLMSDSGPLGQMMRNMQGAAPGSTQGAGKSGMLSSMQGGAGMAGVLAAAGGSAAAAQGQGMSQLFDAFNTRENAPEAEEAAALMLRAMIQAAKSDGEIDEEEKGHIMKAVGPDADKQDIDFVREQLAAPLDPEGLAKDTPEAQKMQVYAASLMTIRVDTDAEAKYLDALARAMGLEETTVNTLHLQMGMQPLYA